MYYKAGIYGAVILATAGGLYGLWKAAGGVCTEENGRCQKTVFGGMLAFLAVLFAAVYLWLRRRTSAEYTQLGDTMDEFTMDTFDTNVPVAETPLVETPVADTSIVETSIVDTPRA